MYKKKCRKQSKESKVVKESGQFYEYYASVEEMFAEIVRDILNSHGYEWGSYDEVDMAYTVFGFTEEQYRTIKDAIDEYVVIWDFVEISDDYDRVGSKGVKQAFLYDKDKVVYEDHKRVDGNIEKISFETSEIVVEQVKFNYPTEYVTVSGFVSFHYKEDEEEQEQVGVFIIYPDSGKIAFENSYDEKTYDDLIGTIQESLWEEIPEAYRAIYKNDYDGDIIYEVLGNKKERS